MAAAQTLPNISQNVKFASLNQQNANKELTLEVAQVRLTTAQLQALKATAIQLTPTPDPGEVIFVHGLVLKYNFGSAAFTLNAGTLKLFVGPVANAHPITADLTTAFLTAAASRVLSNVQTLIVAAETIANGVEKPILIGNDGAAEFTVGTGSTVDVTIIYGRTTA